MQRYVQKKQLLIHRNDSYNILKQIEFYYCLQTFDDENLTSEEEQGEEVEVENWRAAFRAEVVVD